jgi:hypothetical protein
LTNKRLALSSFGKQSFGQEMNNTRIICMEVNNDKLVQQCPQKCDSQRVDASLIPCRGFSKVVSDTLIGYSNLDEVSATLDRLKERALQKVRSVIECVELEQGGNYKTSHRQNFEDYNGGEIVVAHQVVIGKTVELMDDHNNVVKLGVNTRSSPITEDIEPRVINEGEQNPPLKENNNLYGKEAITNAMLCNSTTIYLREEGDPEARLCKTRDFGALAINIMPEDNFVQREKVLNTWSFKINETQPLMKLNNLMEVSPISSNFSFQKTTNGELHSQVTCLDHDSNNNDVNSKCKDHVENNQLQEEHKKILESAGNDHAMTTSTCLEHHEAVASDPQQEPSPSIGKEPLTLQSFSNICNVQMLSNLD